MGKIGRRTKKYGKFQASQLKKVCKMQHIYLLKKMTLFLILTNISTIKLSLTSIHL